MRIVEKIEPGIDPSEVTCTTYQMRNPFVQFADGVASELDEFCYHMHARAADLCPNGGVVLDVCCGRGLLIPFLRYRAKPSLYVGADIDPGNARWRAPEFRDPRRESSRREEWGFPRVYVESNVDAMSGPVLHATAGRKPDLIVYTSSIEHMQPSSQARSLKECALVASEDAVLYLTCPVTQPGQDGYDAQYAAHVYEPKETELREWLREAGWQIRRRTGLVTKIQRAKKVLCGARATAFRYVTDAVPRELALVIIATMWPDCATEIAFECVRR